jgi:hypothetical protein
VIYIISALKASHHYSLIWISLNLNNYHTLLENSITKIRNKISDIKGVEFKPPKMLSQVVFSPPAVAEVFGEACNYGYLTFNQRLALQNVLLNFSVSEEDQESIDRLLHAVRRGWLKIID